MWTAGQALEVVLAKPQAEKKPDGGYAYNPGLHPNHLSHPGYGNFSGNLYGSVGAGYGVAAGYQQVFSNARQIFIIVVFDSQFILCSDLFASCVFLCTIKQPMIYGRGPMPAGMQMVPMVLPDGRIGYVL